MAAHFGRLVTTEVLRGAGAVNVGWFPAGVGFGGVLSIDRSLGLGNVTVRGANACGSDCPGPPGLSSGGFGAA